MNGVEALNLGWRRRLPMMFQAEAAECGLACLAMLAAYFGHNLDLTELRRRFGISLRGTTLRDLLCIGDQLQLASRPVQLELEELALLKTPCILHWDLNHFVVLRRVKRGFVLIHDPAVGIRRLSLSQLSRHFTGIALELSPMTSFEPVTAAPRVRLRSLLGGLVGIKRSLAQLLLLALAIEGFAMVAPLFVEWVVDQALVSADADLLLMLVLGFAALLLLQTSVSAMRGWMLIALGASLKVQARNNLFAHLIRLPASFFEARHLGDVMSRFGSQEALLQALTTDAVEAVLDGLLCGLTLAIMFAFSPLLTVIVLVGAVLYGGLRWISYTTLRQASMEAIVWSARRDSHFLETLRGIKTIKLFNAQEDRRAHWLNLLVATINRQLTGQRLDLLFRTSNKFLLGALTLVIVWLGARRVLENSFSVGMLVAFLAYKDQFLGRVSEMINKAADLRMLGIHAERLADIAVTAPEPRGYIGEVRRDRAPLSIEVRDLSFRYGANEPWILENVSFRITAGESVAIIGASGCGKTTLLKCLAGLLEPSTGTTYVDGEPLARIGLDRYRAMLGVVMQDDQLFAGAIADNICFFSPHPDRERIERCAQTAALDADIQKMPMGYESLIGDMGTVLSGGQKQRVLIARALYREPSLLLLDEATSHLDVECEKSINTALNSSPVTRMVIAHRPETISASERVILLEGGKVRADTATDRLADVSPRLARQLVLSGAVPG